MGGTDRGAAHSGPGSACDRCYLIRLGRPRPSAYRIARRVCRQSVEWACASICSVNVTGLRGHNKIAGLIAQALGCQGGSRVHQQLAQQRTMAPRLVLAIATHGQARLPRHSRQQLNEMASFRLGHLSSIRPRVLRPPLVRPRFRQRPRHHLGRWRQLGQPDVEVIERREVLLSDAARWPPNRPDPNSLVRKPRLPQSNDANCHGPCVRTVFCSVMNRER